MPYETILLKKSVESVNIIMNRTKQRNSINNTLLKEINQVLDMVEQEPACRIVVLEGQPGYFCTGQDFEEASSLASQKEIPVATPGSNPFLKTIKRFTLTPKVIVSLIDGQVAAGGVGLAAASDLVIGTSRSGFCLSEGLWGLLPAIVMPFLIRRVGFQVAYRMMLTTMTIPASEAHKVHLIDEISETPHESIHRLWLRLSRLDECTIKAMKQFARKMWLINEKMEESAVTESIQRFLDPGVIENITNYIKNKRFPWERKEMNKPD